MSEALDPEAGHVSVLQRFMEYRPNTVWFRWRFVEYCSEYRALAWRFMEYRYIVIRIQM